MFEATSDSFTTRFDVSLSEIVYDMSQAFELVCGAMATEFQFNQRFQIRRKLKTFMLSEFSPSSK